MTLTQWQEQALLLKRAGRGPRRISRMLSIPYSTVHDFLRRYASRGKVENNTIIYIPDNQVRPGVSFEYLRCIGEYLALKKPQTIVSAGDFADMESLSSYDKGKASAEGKRVAADIRAAKDGMDVLLGPVRREMLADPSWQPRLVMTLGNHEQRIMRHVDANPELVGFLNYDSLGYKEAGWEVYDFLQPVVIDGVTFIHYYPNPMTGKPLGGSAANILMKVGVSVVQGHKQTLDAATRTLHNGVQQWSIVAGACYDFDEAYKGYTGNKHWRGIVVLHGVKDGGFDPLFVSLDYLMKRFTEE